MSADTLIYLVMQFVSLKTIVLLILGWLLLNFGARVAFMLLRRLNAVAMVKIDELVRLIELKLDVRQGAQDPAYIDAIKVFGLSQSFTKAEFETRYSKIISGIRPEMGGAAMLTYQVNAARDLIMRKRAWR